MTQDTANTNEYLPMRPIKITYADGQVLHTQINGSKREVIEYYVGRVFNIGFGEYDNLLKCVKVEFL